MKVTKELCDRIDRKMFPIVSDPLRDGTPSCYHYKIRMADFYADTDSDQGKIKGTLRPTRRKRS